MKIVCVGAGPAGLYFALLMKKLDPSHEVRVIERNPLDATYGFGVVFNRDALETLEAADAPSYRAIAARLERWEDIHIRYRDSRRSPSGRGEGTVPQSSTGRSEGGPQESSAGGGEISLASTGHGFSGISRRVLLMILSERAEELGVELRLETEVDDLGPLLNVDLVVGADGANSLVRDTRVEHFEPSIDVRPNKFVWMGTTREFSAFTFYFKRNEHGLWRVHAYRYAPGKSTFIVETTAETFEASGLDPEDELATAAYCEELFADELQGHELLTNRSIWRSFATIKTERWYRGNVVLIGDAAHTAHFSVGSGTRLAVEDAVVLAQELHRRDPPAPDSNHRDALGPDTRQLDPTGPGTTGRHRLGAALAAYQERRKPEVESMQRAAQASLEFFEDTELFIDADPIQFGFNLLTRSFRITHQDLKVRDPSYIADVDRWFASLAAEQANAGTGTRPGSDGRDQAGGARERATESGATRRAAGACGDPHDAPPPMFTPFRLRDMLLINRVVVSPMCQYRAEDGTPNEWHFVHLGSRAVGGAGLVMTEMTDVSRSARITPGCAGMYKAEHAQAWGRIVDFVHRHSHAKVGMQLAHAGRKGATKLAWEGMDEPLEEGAWPIIAASPIPYLPHSKTPKQMDRDDMDGVLDDFVRAARMAEGAGFDIIELHFAHGYLLAGFISPLTNRRDDEYGGSIDNRMRYPLEIFDAVRDAWPDHKPISVRISAVDWVEGGQDIDDSVEVARMLKDRGCDIIDVSAGQTVPDARPEYGRQYQTPFSNRIRNVVSIPTIAVGNISSYMDVNTILAAGRADLCALARAHLWDPYWTRNAAHKQGFPLPWPDPYSVLDRYTPRFE